MPSIDVHAGLYVILKFLSTRQLESRILKKSPCMYVVCASFLMHYVSTKVSKKKKKKGSENLAPEESKWMEKDLLVVGGAFSLLLLLREDRI